MKNFIFLLLPLAVSTQYNHTQSTSLDPAILHNHEQLEKGCVLDTEYDKEFTDIVEFVYGADLLSQGGSTAIDMMFEGVDLNDQKVLDIGFGLGGVDFYLAGRYRVHIVGVDRVRRLVEEARARKVNYQLCGDVVFLHQKTEADLSNFTDESFDVVFAKESLLHVDNINKDELLKHVFRILRPGGKIIILDWLIPTSELGVNIKEMMRIDNLDLKLATSQQYVSLLRQSGFSNISLSNKNKDYIVYTNENVQRVKDAQSEFISKFGKENYDYSLDSWQLQKKAFKTNEVEVTLLTAVKPSRCT